MFFTRFKRGRFPAISFVSVTDMCSKEFKDETDINSIVSHYVRTGSVPGVRPGAFTTRHPMFGDFSGVRDLSEALRLSDASKSAFMELSPEIRNRFSNSVENLYKFLQNPENRAEAEEMGLVERRPQPVSDQPPIMPESVSPVIQPEAVESGKIE